MSQPKWVMFGFEHEGEHIIVASLTAEIEVDLRQEPNLKGMDPSVNHIVKARVRTYVRVTGGSYNDAMDALLTAGWDPDDLRSGYVPHQAEFLSPLLEHVKAHDWQRDILKHMDLNIARPNWDPFRGMMD